MEEDLLKDHINQNKILMMNYIEDVFKEKSEPDFLDEVEKMIEKNIGMIDKKKRKKIQSDTSWPIDKILKSILETIRDEVPPKIVANKIMTSSARLFSLKELQDLFLI
ncbi:hypothetical protein SteCoe_9355 [Stentor coeruleus]|uniref:Uncharacterized protein n=1 Tax=Stentor coeruleus TaxID=5963 RepID=A0A1R2CI21_9CILI|nr:hypothetical protein SteCoe_9355 [Stentor coeruleus]